jgi:hypothetical protein
VTAAAGAEGQRVASFGRLDLGLRQATDWYLWGPYLSERQWGTVREDYSVDGDAWSYLPHDHARSRAYRWGEDGLAGFCDIEQRLCLALTLWNGRDPILKERAFGLTGGEGNHGEDVKEYWWYRDAVPSHAWNSWRYHYPQRAFPYQQLLDENRSRSKSEPEYELLDTGIFDDDRYWIVAKPRNRCEESLLQIYDRFAARLLEAGDVLEPADRHAQVQLREERVQEVSQALAAAVGQGVCVRPADSDRLGAPRQCDHDVCRIPYAGIEHDRSGAGRRHDSGQELDCRNIRISLAATMIGAIQYIGAIVDRHPRIIRVLNPLHRDRQMGLRPNPTEVVPRQRVLEDLPVVLQCSGLVFVGWLCKVFGEVLVGVVVLHAETAELRKVAQLQI